MRNSICQCLRKKQYISLSIGNCACHRILSLSHSPSPFVCQWKEQGAQHFHRTEDIKKTKRNAHTLTHSLTQWTVKGVFNHSQSMFDCASPWYPTSTSRISDWTQCVFDAWRRSCSSVHWLTSTKVSHFNFDSTKKVFVTRAKVTAKVINAFPFHHRKYSRFAWSKFRDANFFLPRGTFFFSPLSVAIEWLMTLSYAYHTHFTIPNGMFFVFGVLVAWRESNISNERNIRNKNSRRMMENRWWIQGSILKCVCVRAYDVYSLRSAT